MLIQSKSDAVPLVIDPSLAEVTFEDVGFHYISGKQILNGLSFTVKPGQKVAIVGGSGSG